MNQWIRHIGEYKRDTLITPICMMLEVVLDVIIPLLMANMIDSGIGPGDMGVVGRTGLYLVLACMASLLFGALSGRYAARASAGFGKNIRGTMFDKIQGFSFGSIDKFSTSSLVTRLTTDVTNVQNAFQMIIRLCVRSPLMIIFAVAMVLRINASLAWIFLCVIPVLAGGLALILTRAMPAFTRVFKLYDRLNTVVQENVRGIRVVKSYVREDHEVEKFKETSGKIYDNFVIAEKIVAFNSPLMQFCVYACTLMICWFGARLIVADRFTTGQLMSLLTYTMQILMSLMMLSMVFVMLTISKASAARIGEVMRETTDMQDGDASEVRDGSVCFENVDFGYRGKDGELCLRNIDIRIESGQTVGIVGGTGSGKTSLTQLIPRLYDATNGRVLVGGRDVREYQMQALRDEVAMVLQKNVLFAGTIKDNLRWGDKNATDEQMRRACQLAQASEFIEAMPGGYDTWIEQGGANVSGGQKQRLCIARALLKNPKILIMDDSTSAVDTKTDALIRKAFAEGIPSATKIIIAQRVSSVMDADQIIVMDDGRVSAVGDHAALMEKSAIYREVYESQQKGGLGDGAA